MTFKLKHWINCILIPVFALLILIKPVSAQSLYYFVDSASKYTPGEAIQQPFTAVKDEAVLNFGISNATIWIKVVQTKDDSIQKRNHFMIANPLIDTVTSYGYYNQTLTEINQTGFLIPAKRKLVNHQYQLIDISSPALNNTGTYYLKMTCGTQLTVPFTKSTESDMFKMLNQKDLSFAIYLCILLVMLVYNLFVYITVRDKSYLYYIIYLIASIYTQTSLDGYLHRFILTDQPVMARLSIYISSALIGFTALEFMRIFIKLDNYLPKSKYFLNFFYSVYVVAVTAAILGYYNAGYAITLLNASLTSFFALICSIMVALKGYRPAKFYVFAWSIFIIGVWTYVLKDLGVIPYNFFTSISLQVGSAIETILLSFALADKINIYRKEKDIAQAEALQIAQKNEQLIREQNVTLELKVTERTQELATTNHELNKTLSDLKETQSQLVESEKMASLGQLTAGIAHEINNPINFVTSNVNPLKRDVDILLDLIKRIEKLATNGADAAEKEKQIIALKNEFDFDYLQEEITFLLKGINEGSSRTAEIVKGLRIFSRVDEDDLKKADVNEGLDSTIIIINNLLNGKIVIQREYGTLPLVECYPGKLNQVFLNLISNAIYAVNAKFEGSVGGVITIATTFHENTVRITIGDNGVGMTEATLKKLFEPFFTTKPVGEGTGLGLSISYNTIKKHNGIITVNSKLNEGTNFIIEIPIIQTIN